MKQKKLTVKQCKRSLVKQYKAIECGDIPKTGRYDPIIDFVLTVDGLYGDSIKIGKEL